MIYFSERKYTSQEQDDYIQEKTGRKRIFHIIGDSAQGIRTIFLLCLAPYSVAIRPECPG
jgi:hypothetical protein